MNNDQNKVNALIKEIENLTINETLEIVKYFYEKFPFLQESTQVVQKIDNDNNNLGSDNKDKLKNIIIKSFDSNIRNKTKLILILSKIKNITPSQSKSILEKLPYILKENTTLKEFEDMKKKFASVDVNFILK